MPVFRNQLVWLTAQGWELLSAQALQPRALQAVQHWRVHGLPLVVASPHPGCAPGHMSLGLPAPLQWERLRLSFQLPESCIARSGSFPGLTRAAHAFGWSRQSRAFETAMALQGISVQVYGSFGWQLLTGMAYVRDSSDIDLLLQLPATKVPENVCELLQAQQWGRHIDGEIRFASGHALAWREWQQLQRGQVQEVLLKSRAPAQMVPAHQLQEVLHGAAH